MMVLVESFLVRRTVRLGMAGGEDSAAPTARLEGPVCSSPVTRRCRNGSDGDALPLGQRACVPLSESDVLTSGQLVLLLVPLPLSGKLLSQQGTLSVCLLQHLPTDATLTSRLSQDAFHPISNSTTMPATSGRRSTAGKHIQQHHPLPKGEACVSCKVRP